MRRFALSYFNFESTVNKQRVLLQYFSQASDLDKMAALKLFLGVRPKRLLSLSQLKELAYDESGISSWLLDESHKSTDDICETAALLFDTIEASPHSLQYWIEQIHLKVSQDAHEVHAWMTHIWHNTSQEERFILNKLVTGTFRKKIDIALLADVLSQITTHSRTSIAYILNDKNTILKQSFESTFSESNLPDPKWLPGRFEEIDELPKRITALEKSKTWSGIPIAHGIRCQIIMHQNQFICWSEAGNIVLKDSFEIDSGRHNLSAFVLEGEYNGDLHHFFIRHILGFALLNQEHTVEDHQDQPIPEYLQIADASIEFSFLSSVSIAQWSDLPEIILGLKSTSFRGLQLFSNDRSVSRTYLVSLPPHTLCCILLYAERKRGGGARQFSEYTFGVKSKDELVPIAKCSEGLSLSDKATVDAYIQKNIVDRFGPVLVVKPALIFELSFEGIRASSRTKSGLKLIQSKIVRHIKQGKPTDIDELAVLTNLMY